MQNVHLAWGHSGRGTVLGLRKRAELVRQDEYASIRGVLGKALYSDYLPFTDSLMGLVESGLKTQTTRDWISWRWDRVIAERAEKREWMVVERNPYCREIVGVVRVGMACIRRISDMVDSEWALEGIQQMPMVAFVKKHIGVDTPCDRSEYERLLRGRKSSRKVGILRFGDFIGIGHFLTVKW